VKDFRELKVWQKAHVCTLAVYKATGSFPPDERFGLTSQIRRSCGSIGANIAEGCGRGSDADLARFLQIAMGSASETEYHLLLAFDLDLIDEATYRSLTDAVSEVKRMLASFILRLRPASNGRRTLPGD